MPRQALPRPDEGLDPALIELALSGQTLADMLGLKVESPEKAHYLAYTYYTQGKYEEAMRLFTYLMTGDHMERRYHLGFALCLQKLRRHEEALKHFGFASLLDLTDPEPVMRSAQCYIALGNLPKARMGLEYALMQAETHAAHKRFVPRLQGMLALLGDEAQATGTTN